VFLSSVLHANVGELFSGMNVLGCYQFRVTRNSDLFVDEEEIKNLRTALQGELPQRHFGDAVRLEVADSCSRDMTDFLLQQFDLGRTTSTACRESVNLVRLMQVPDWSTARPEVPALRSPACPSRWPRTSRHLRQHPQAATCCCTTPTSRSTR
jgi:polyphosphate kinase